MNRNCPRPPMALPAGWVTTLILLPALLLCWTLPVLAKNNQVLYINSYHVGYKWSDELYSGFLETVRPQLGTIELHVEYLDMKRHYSEERYEHLAQSLALKYRKIPIDAIVASDDAAFIFLQRFGHQIFPDIPVFFCGTNYLTEQDLEGLPLFKGVTEQADITETIDTILSLLPETEQIYIINDLTVTGRKVRDQIEQVMISYSDRLTFTLWDDIAMPDLITRVNNLPAKSVIFYTFFLQDNTGQTFEYDQSISLLHRQSPVPIFGAWDFNLGLGLTGGMLTSAKKQGEKVAELLIDYYSGKPLATLPRITSSPNSYMFDFSQLTAFGIDPARLPAGSLVINRPVSFFEKHREVLVVSGVFIGLLLLVITLLSINIIMRKRAEAELRQSEENFRAIFNNASDGLYQASADGRFLRVNPALAQMLKFPSPAAVVTHFTDITKQLYTSPEDCSEFIQRRSSKGWARGEHQLTCLDGTIIDVLENAHKVKDSQDRFLYYEGSIINLTEYKKTQELIAQTDKIISLGGVSAGIAHEIRSPLASIIQGVQIVQSRIYENSPANLNVAKECGLPLAKVRSYLDKRSIDELLSYIFDAGKRAGVIIEDMLSFSKNSIGDFSHESLADILEKSIELAAKDFSLRHECSFGSIRIVREYDPDLPIVQCSHSKIQQVFFNILKNGAEAMSSGATKHPSFTLRTSRIDGAARIEIEDNGPGMEPELQAKIFDPFYTTKERNRGTGLGLSVSYFIITENHHGQLRLKSEPGKGSTFIIELPLKQTVLTAESFPAQNS